MKHRVDRQGMIYVRRGMARVNTYDLMLFLLAVVQSAITAHFFAVLSQWGVIFLQKGGNLS